MLRLWARTLRRLPLGRGQKAGPPAGRPPCPNERGAGSSEDDNGAGAGRRRL